MGDIVPEGIIKIVDEILTKRGYETTLPLVFFEHEHEHWVKAYLTSEIFKLFEEEKDFNAARELVKKIDAVSSDYRYGDILKEIDYYEVELRVTSFFENKLKQKTFWQKLFG